MQKLVILLTAFLLITGCENETAETSKNETGEKISIKFEDRQISFAPSYAKFAAFKKGLILKDSDIQNKNERAEAVVHRIYLADYDLQLTDPSKQDYRRIGSDGQHRVEIQIEAEKGAPENAPLKVGEYREKSDPFDRISSVTISRFRDGKDSSHILGGRSAKGAVKILSVSDAQITGEIDFSDTDGSVKGKFTAQRLGK